MLQVLTSDFNLSASPISKMASDIAPILLVTVIVLVLSGQIFGRAKAQGLGLSILNWRIEWTQTPALRNVIVERSLMRALSLMNSASFSTSGYGTNRVPLKTLLLSRAAPNRRLIHSFGISNSFTITEEKEHLEFRRAVQNLLGLCNVKHGWTGIISEAKKNAAEGARYLSNWTTPGDGCQRFVVELVPLVQTMVLKTILRVLFQESELGYIHGGRDDAEEMLEEERARHNAALCLAQRIEDIWLASKNKRCANDEAYPGCCPNDELPPMHHLLDPVLQESIQILLPQHPVNRLACETGQTCIDRRENPLNLILPAYETLWRVVMLCYLEIRFRSSPTDQEQYRQLFDDAGSEGFQTRVTLSGVSAVDVINETLRLYPPTKRIYRKILLDANEAGSGTPESSSEGLRNFLMAAIDLEFLHQDPKVWGLDSYVFRPARWVELREIKTASKSFMPFGSSRTLCPAQKVFGPKMIGIFVGALVTMEKEMKEKWEVVQDGLLEDEKGRLSNTRGAYRKLEICRNMKV